MIHTLDVKLIIILHQKCTMKMQEVCLTIRELLVNLKQNPVVRFDITLEYIFRIIRSRHIQKILEQSES